jgi:hypothetical protein
MINPDNFMVNHFHLIFDMNQKKKKPFLTALKAFLKICILDLRKWKISSIKIIEQLWKS